MISMEGHVTFIAVLFQITPLGCPHQPDFANLVSHSDLMPTTEVKSKCYLLVPSTALLYAV